MQTARYPQAAVIHRKVFPSVAGHASTVPLCSVDYEISADAVIGLTAVITGEHCILLDDVEAQAFLEALAEIRQCWIGPEDGQLARAIYRVTERRLLDMDGAD